MLTDLLDLLTPQQTFEMLNDFCSLGWTISRANVKCWMRGRAIAIPADEPPAREPIDNIFVGFARMTVGDVLRMKNRR